MFEVQTTGCEYCYWSAGHAKSKTHLSYRSSYKAVHSLVLVDLGKYMREHGGVMLNRNEALNDKVVQELQRLCLNFVQENDSVEGAAVTDRDGKFLAGVLPGYDAARAALSGAEAYATCQRAMEKLNLGSLQNVSTLSTMGRTVITDFGSGLFIVFCCENDFSLWCPFHGS